MSSVGIVEFLGRDEMTELVLTVDDLVLDVERSQEDIDAHVVRTKSEFELESFEDGVCEQSIRLEWICVRSEDGGLHSIDAEAELEDFLMNFVQLRNESISEILAM